MQFGTSGDTQGKWFTLSGVKRRLCGRFPSVLEWEGYMTAVEAVRSHGTPAPLEPVKRDVTAFYRVAREHVLPLLSGIEIDADACEVNESSWWNAVATGGIYQNVLADFAGWLFCDAAEFCDDGPDKA